MFLFLKKPYSIKFGTLELCVERLRKQRGAQWWRNRNNIDLCDNYDLFAIELLIEVYEYLFALSFVLV